MSTVALPTFRVRLLLFDSTTLEHVTGCVLLVLLYSTPVSTHSPTAAIWYAAGHLVLARCNTQIKMVFYNLILNNKLALLKLF